MNKHLLFVFSLGVGLLVATGAKAEILTEVSLRLDAATIEKGYTLTDASESFFVGVTPKAVAEPITVNVRELSLDEFPAPADMTVMSRLFQYDIPTQARQPLARPIFIKLAYQPTDGAWPTLMFFDGISRTWKPLPSTFDPQTNTAKAISHLPFSRIAVFGQAVDDALPLTMASISSAAPGINAAAAIIINEATGEVLYEKNADQVRSIASLTKLVSAQVVLDTQPSFSSVVALRPEDNAIGAKLYANSGETLRFKDLFYTTLVGSANNTAKAMARATGVPREDFVQRMNTFAERLNLKSTSFTDPTGLDVTNQSTAREYIVMARKVLRHPEILKATTVSAYDFSMLNTGIPHHIKNTNRLIGKTQLYILGSKTGYLDEAGYCLLTRAKSADGSTVISLVLGAGTRTQSEQDTERLVRWGLDQI